MVSNMKNKQICVSNSVRNICTIPAICIMGILLFLSASLPAQQPNSTGSQAASTNSDQPTVTIPAGTRMMVKMIDPVDSKKNNENDRFRGSLETNLSVNSQVVAPKGTTVFGRLITAQAASSGQAAQLELDLTDIVIDGQTYSLTTSSKQVEGESAGGGETGRGAGKGAAIGTVTGGLSGAVRGAGVGAIAGSIVGGSTSGPEVNVSAGALVEFTLKHPVSLPAAK
jgi:hypothetical protein